MSKKLLKNKIAKGLISLITIIILLSSILATSIYYSGNITGFVVSDVSINQQSTTIKIQEVNDIKELNQLNEGWYQIRNGYVFYLDTFNSYVPLWIKVKNPEQQNGLLVVDEDGNVEFYSDVNTLGNSVVVDEIKEEIIENEITEKVTGLEKVSGFAVKYYDESGTKELPTQPVSGRYIIEYTDQNKRDLYDGSKLIKTQIKVGGVWKDQQIVKYYDVYIDSITYLTIQAQSPQEASKSVKDETGITPVKVTESKTGVGTTISPKFNIILGNGRVYKISAVDLTDAENKANALAPKLGTNVKSVETVKFIVKDKNTGDEYEIEDVPDAQAAAVKAREEYGIVPGPVRELKPLSIEPTQTYIVTLYKDNKPFKTITILAKNENEADEKVGNLAIKWDADYYLPERKISFEEFKKLNPGISQRDLEQAYKQKYVQKAEEVAKEKQVTLKPIVDEQGNEIAWVVDGKLSFKKEEALARFNQLIAENEAKVIAKEQKLTLLKELDTSGRPIAKDSSGNVYLLIDSDSKREYVKTDNYAVSEKITKDDKTIEITKRYSRYPDKKQYEEIENVVKITDKEFAIVDSATAKRVKEAFNSGLSVKVSGSTTGENIVEIRDKQDNVVERFTFSKPPYQYFRESVTKTTEQFKTIFLDKDNNEISAEKAKQLKEKGEVVNEKQIHTFRLDEERKEGKVEFLTTYSFSVEESIEVYEATKINQKTGYVEEFTFGRGNDKIVIESERGGFGFKDIISPSYKVKEVKGDQSLLESEVVTKIRQLASRQFFAEVERVLTEFSGLGYYATLFFDEDSLLEWRDNVDRTFATLYLGTEYWASAICGNYLDGEDEGIAYAETPQGLAQVAAHIEATRQEIILPIGIESSINLTGALVLDNSVLEGKDIDKITGFAVSEDRLVGYGPVNYWDSHVDVNQLADALARNGLTLTIIEYVPGGSEDPDPRNTHREKAKALVEAMRKKGVWTFINIANWNGRWLSEEASDAWFREEFEWIKNNIGTDKVILQAASEWGGDKARRWADIVAREWPGMKSWNEGSRPRSAPAGHMIEYHTCDPSDTGPGGGNVIVTSDCSPIINWLNGCDAVGGDVCFGRQADKNKVRSYVKDVLSRGSNFAFYGVENKGIDIAAIEAIGEALRGEGGSTPSGSSGNGARDEDGRDIKEKVETAKPRREFLYKITFNVRNGDFDKDPRAPEEMNINVVLKGERTATVFKQDQKVKRGSTFGRTGRSAIVQDSKTFFNEVCLTFDKVPSRWKVSNNEICNIIVESSGAPTTVSTTTTTTTAGGGSVESEINDF